MNEHDLHTSLGDLARRTSDEQTDRQRRGDGLSADHVTTTARRYRRRRSAVATVAGLVVVGAAAVAGATVVDRPVPAPPATPTPAPSPSPSVTPTPGADPTPTGTVLPTGDPSLVLGACGSVLGGPTDVPLDDRWSVSTQLDATEVVVGQDLPVRTGLGVNLPEDWSPIGIGFGAHPDSGPEFLVLRDGVVVAVTDLYRDVVAPLTWYDVAAGANGTAFQGDLELASCVDGGDLPPGSYELVATMRVLPLGDDDAIRTRIDEIGVDAVAAGREGDWRRTIDDPLPFTVVPGAPPATAPAPEVDVRAFVADPACGGPVTTSAGPTMTLDVASSGSQVTGSMTFAGPGRFRAQTQITPTLWVVQDGVVIGSTPDRSGADYAIVDLGPGSAIGMSTEVDLRRCVNGWPGEEPLPPGTYTVVPAVQLFGVEIRTADGMLPVGGGSTTSVVGAPLTVVVP